MRITYAILKCVAINNSFPSVPLISLLYSKNSHKIMKIHMIPKVLYVLNYSIYREIDPKPSTRLGRKTPGNS